MIPDVSVIIPAYNTEAYIAQAIESALQQTITNIEVIVVDDASTDSTVNVVNEFSDQRLRLFKNKKNLGVSGTRNYAVNQARGTWIAVLDSDDWYAPERLEKLLQLAWEKESDVVADNLHFIRDNDTTPWTTLVEQSGEQIDDIKQIDAVYFVETGIYGQQGLHLGLSKPLFKQSFLMTHGIQYDETKQVVEDFHLILQCLARGAKFIFTPQPYYFYRSRSGSLVTQSKVRHINQFRQAILDFLQEEIIQQNPDLVCSLSKSLKALDRNKAYYSVVEPLKKKNFLEALLKAIQNPYFFVHFASQLDVILIRRFRYFFLKDELVYEMMYRKK